MTTTVNAWKNWAGVSGYSGFQVASGDGEVEMAQVNAKNFVVATPFVFADADTLDKLQQSVEANGHAPAVARQMVDQARTFGGDDERTDLASVPQFMSWFEAPYGRHTLAAMIHDRLITDGAPNTGALGSDTLADSFFRNMMGVAGVPFFKRWIMWAAVAMRTRFAAGGWRRVSLILWGICAVVGNVLVLAAIGRGLFGWSRLFGLHPAVSLGIAAVLPFVSGLLWGKQFGASVVAAAAGAWLTPAAGIVLVGLLGYKISERVACGWFERHGERPTRTWDAPQP